jgi:Do/DeqQ family serine protease
MKKYILVTIIGVLSGMTGMILGFNYLKDDLLRELAESPPAREKAIDGFDRYDSQDFDSQQLVSNRDILAEKPSFVEASEVSTSSVVFITTLTEYEYRTGTMFDWFFEPRTSQRVGSGSGVIFTADGYIVTNNHVIDDADEIKVTMGKRSFAAKLIGRDPSTDLAVIKVDAEDLPTISIGNSDEVKVGQWVLAVGNPFNLTSTVTAGIVSAKGRNINILKDKFPIESFIQTDAAINPGNSGGALVNQEGQLIGINTAILSRTGSYAGYGFAVPANIVKKVFNDIVKYGEVQKAFSGMDLIDIDSKIADKLDLESLDGILVGNTQAEGAAEQAGIKEGDVIVSVNGKDVDNKAYFEEYVANLYPGDKVSLQLIREGKRISKEMTLLNRDGETGVIEREIFESKRLDAKFERVSKVEKNLLSIETGVKVVDFEPGGFFAQLDIPKGFIITAINRRPIDDPEELAEILSKIKGRVEIYGIDNNGRKVYYPYYSR